MSVGFPTLEHATYSCPCEKHGSQCCHAVGETFPRKDETGFEGRRRYINTWASDTGTHVTVRVGSTVLSSR
jgi:peptidyl-tRNA hydrolase